MSSPGGRDLDKEEQIKAPLFRETGAQHTETSNGKCSLRCYKIGIGVLVSALIVAAAYIVYNKYFHEVGNSGKNKSPSDDPQKGAVVSDNEVCSEVGRSILAKHGTAVDAAIATLICNGVHTPHSMGIGGGCFMVIYDRSSQRSIFIDGRETGPLNMSAEDFYAISQNPAKYNARRIGVPGELKAYKRAHDQFGKLPWKDLFQPTIDLMKNGIKLRDATAKALEIMAKRFQGMGLSLAYFSAFCEVFCSNTTTGEPLKSGQKYKWPTLRKTLIKIADEGPDYLYDSPVTHTIVKELQNRGSLIRLTDFTRDYDVISGPSLQVDYGDLSMYTIGRATGGPVLAEILNIVEGYKFTNASVSTDMKTADMYHKMIEAFKFAYNDRQALEDPNYGKNIEKHIKRMVSKETAAKIRDQITDSAHDSLTDYTEWSDPSHSVDMGTSHVSVLSPYGDAVSVTSTVNWYFGCLEMSSRTGIIWNNEMDDFSKRASHTNVYHPGKRPRSSMAPAIIVDKKGNVKFVVGASGGSRITTAVAQVIAKMLWMENSLEKVINEKRIHHGLIDSKGELATLELENGFNETMTYVTEELVRRNHTMTSQRFPTMSVVESIFVHNNGTVEGVPDERKLHRPS